MASGVASGSTFVVSTPAFAALKGDVDEAQVAAHVSTGFYAQVFNAISVTRAFQGQSGPQVGREPPRYPVKRLANPESW